MLEPIITVEHLTKEVQDATGTLPRNYDLARAILAREKQGDNATFHFSDNLSRAIALPVALCQELVDLARQQRLLTAKGTLEGCSVTSENPGDYGFGDAAIKLSRLFRMKPKTLDGSPVDGGQITIPIVFTVPR